MDPYRVLNLSRDADGAAIKAAYRRLAKTLHPDRNPGDPRAEARFKDLTQAYELLSDPQKRAAYDRGLIDGEGKPRAGFGFGGFNSGSGAGAYAGGADRRFWTGFEGIFEKAFGGGFGRGPGGGADAGNVQSPFEELLRGRGAQGARTGGTQRRMRGADLRERLEIDFLMAARGGRQRLQLADGRAVEVDVPAGTQDGQTLRLKRQGRSSPAGGEPGDVLLEIKVRAHPRFKREGDNVLLDLPVSLPEAVLGAKVMVPTIDGPVRITVPAGSNTGRTLRLRGRGIVRRDGTRGDQLVRLLVMLPEPQHTDLADELRRWAQKHSYDVRGDLEPV